MKTGIVFDIQEFSVQDGPGIRTTVFLKGCPLRCHWCHNPEGLLEEPQEISSPAGKRIAGKEYTSAELAILLNEQANILTMNEGGVTFSGGEPLFQASFVSEVIDRIPGLHVLLDTSGYADGKTFRFLAKKSDMIFFDLKLMDTDLHKRWTGVHNQSILSNLKWLGNQDQPSYFLRVPLIPDVTDSRKNLQEIADMVNKLQRKPEQIHLLPYNKTAGSKYASCGMKFTPEYDEQKENEIDLSIFKDCEAPVSIIG